ncbi:MAG: DUF5110 domain-containing protein [Bacteroidales bacterium]|nr:DUF5110 domain-containing protein [Bacteroidales bacterium]
MAVNAQKHTIPFENGTLTLTPLQDNAVRIRYSEGEVKELPEWIYTEPVGKVKCKKTVKGGKTVFRFDGMTVTAGDGKVEVMDKEGRTIFSALSHELENASVQGEPTRKAKLEINSPEDEFLYGLGQFQDGYLNVRGLTRRLTQVNTQISVPFLLSSKGYGILWNNYGLTDFNPADHKVKMDRAEAKGEEITLDVTSTEGNRRETRRTNDFKATIDIAEDGQYAILLDVGQKMARRHDLSIDGKNVINLINAWLPPTTSIIVDLKAGKHEFTAELERGDNPSICYRKVDDRTVFSSPVAECVDYTIFTGDADDIIASYRKVTGEVPLMPSWAFGYIHCRERFHSQEELLSTARRFREEQIPIDLIVQDWQYWGRYGWNAMRFDEEHYPDPAKMVSDLHDMDMKLMISVWSKMDPNSEVGRIAQERGHFIPNTTWIDFFDEDASSFYWSNFRDRLLKPYGIDAWWQDATEPENDDLEGRKILKNTVPGELYRNVYPVMVSKTIFEGLAKDDPERRPMIFTRSGFSGVQRYGAVLWSGDVGNDWKTLRYQISSGLGFVATGLPWWTYDAGGFFRPYDQYSNEDYIERMIRWIQVGTFLPMMRVHGYMSNTEPWQYGPEAQRIITEQIRLRYRLLPYIYSEASRVTTEGYTLMRPLIFDFPDDTDALKQDNEYMFGQSLLVCPVTEKGVSQWRVYLPENEGGWYDFRTGKKYGNGWYEVPVTIEDIPVFAKAGSILPLGPVKQHAAEKSDEPLTINVYPGADACFNLFEDDGLSVDGSSSTIPFTWDDSSRTLTIGKRQGSFEGMEETRTFHIAVAGTDKSIRYDGRKVTVRF